MKIPSTLWIAVALILPPMLIPWIDQFFPTNTYWWSALIVVLLNAAILLVKTYYSQPAPVVTPTPGVGQMIALGSQDPAPEEKHSMLAKLFIYGA